MQKKMTLTQIIQRWIVAIAGTLIVIPGLTSTAALADPPPQGDSAAVFATDTNAWMTTETAVPGAAAIVDGHVIPMEDVVLDCLRKYRSYVIDQMVQNYVVDRECQRRGIVVDQSVIDQRIAELRTNLAPATLEDTLREHHMTMDETRDAFARDIKRKKLVADQIKPVKMVHCFEILVKCASGDAADAGTSRTEAGALAVVNEIQEQIKQGKDFSTMVAHYSESDNKGKSGDMGVLYENILGLVEAPVLDAALVLNKGEISPPIKATDGYHIIKAGSTGDDHSKAEDSIYRDAEAAARHQQIQFLEPKIVVGLIDNSKITFVDDAQLVAGKQLPDAAAVIDGHAIRMQDVAAKCLAEYGPKTTDILVQNYLVDRECERRKIEVSETEIDSQIGNLCKQIAPTPLNEGLKMHHTTMDGLKYDFRQQLERTQLVIDQVKPTMMVHARVVFVKIDPAGASGTRRSADAARTLIATIQDQLKAGRKFEELARQYSEVGNQSDPGDIGILYAGMQNMDTAILHTALAMKTGEVSPSPVQTYGGYFLLQCISTSDNHSSDEDEVYARAFVVRQEQEAQPLIPQAIVALIKKSKVVYYVHS